MLADYPLLLSPHLADRVWAGSRLGAGIGEAWDLSAHPHGPSGIVNGALAGNTLARIVERSPDDFGGPISLLAKRLDCAQDLSFQVHPRSGDVKTESWVVLDAEPSAGVYHGFSKEISEPELRAAAEGGSLPGLMRFLPLRRGQCVFVPTGTVHAIGAGLFLFELQQSADTTYRLFDWGRGRELHLDRAVENADLSSCEAVSEPRPGPEGRARLVECEHFFIDRVEAAGPHLLDPGSAWIAVHLTAGGARIDDLEFAAGGTLLLPRAAGRRFFEAFEGCAALVYGPPVR